MERQFVADSVFPREFTRKHARGYKKIVLADDVNMPCALDFQSDIENGILNITKLDCTADEPDAYTILCKEFGLIGENIKFSSDISVIFCDDGWMLVTLHTGGLVLNLEDRLLFASLHITDAPVFDEDRILWVNADMLKEYSKYWGNKSSFVYDFEMYFSVSGGNVRGCRSFRVKHVDEADIDLSLGVYAQYCKQLEAKEQLASARKMLSFLNNGTSSLEFEDSEEEEDGYEDDEYDDDEYEDE